MKRIRSLIKTMINLVITLGLLGVCVYVDARYIEPRLLIVKKTQVTAKKITQPLRIVQFSDIHLGPYYTLEQLQQLVQKINSLQPDIIIFSGDLIDDNKTFTQEDAASQILKALSSTYGKFAVYGNHDHGSNGTRRYARMMKASGFHLLVNHHEVIQLKDGYQIALIGIDDIVLSKPDIEAAFSKVPDSSYKIFISHAPDVAPQAEQLKANLQLSGHTHGGQIRLPLIGAPFTPPYGEHYIKGEYVIGKSKMPLWVSSGIGVSQLPYRFLNPPEILVITLQPQ